MSVKTERDRLSQVAVALSELLSYRYPPFGAGDSVKVRTRLLDEIIELLQGYQEGVSMIFTDLSHAEFPSGDPPLYEPESKPLYIDGDLYADGVKLEVYHADLRVVRKGENQYIVSGVIDLKD